MVETRKKAATAAPKTKKPATRADLGAPIDGWFAKQPQPQRAIAEILRELIREAAPDATASLKWGMPFFENGGMMCAIGGHKGHVNLILSGPPDAFPDPDGRLAGDGKTGRHLKLRTVEEIPRPAVKRWLKIAAKLARGS